MTENKLNIYHKLYNIQRQISQLVKDELNKFQNYYYFTELQMLSKLRPLLVQEKLVLTFSDELETFTAEKTEKEWVVKYCKKAVLVNSESPTEQLTFFFWAAGQNTDIAKAKGSAETYAVKYFCQKLFLVPASDNLDPDKY